MKRFFVGNIAVCLMLSCSPGLAMGRLAQVDIIDADSGHSLTLYQHRGKSYVAGAPGQRFAIRLKNTQNSTLRIRVGLNGVALDDQGLVLPPLGLLALANWPKGPQNGQALTFSEQGTGYAERMGKPDILGTISFSVWRETTQAAAPGPDSRSNHTDTRTHKAHATHTTPGDMPVVPVAQGPADESIAIHYDAYANLVAMGIIPRTQFKLTGK